MIEIDWRKFYGEDPIQPIPVEKYFFDDGSMLETRQMTYEFFEHAEEEGMYPTFEVNDVIVDDYGRGKSYLIIKFERGFNELYVELLDDNFKPTGELTYRDGNEIFHKLKDVEWI